MSNLPFSDALGVGELLFTSGQIGFDADGKISGDIGEQTRRAMAHLAAVLEKHGCAMSDVLKTTIFLKNAADFQGYNQAYLEAFGDHRPARSTVVAALVFDEALVEIEAIARRRAG